MDCKTTEGFESNSNIDDGVAINALAQLARTLMTTDSYTIPSNLTVPSLKIGNRNVGSLLDSLQSQITSLSSRLDSRIDGVNSLANTANSKADSANSTLTNTIKVGENIKLQSTRGHSGGATYIAACGDGFCSGSTMTVSANPAHQLTMTVSRG